MFIRNMEYADYPLILEKLPAALEQHPDYADYTIDIEYTAGILRALLDSESLYGRLLFDDDYLAGGLCFTMSGMFFSPDREATELLFYVDEYARGKYPYKLLQESIQYADSLGAMRFNIGAKSGYRTESLQKFYLRAGLKPSGGEFYWKRSV